MLVTTKQQPGRPRLRDPEGTRQGLLQAAFEEVHRCGYQSADMDAILNRAGVTKGALYYHFQNKEALGYALVEEVIGSLTREKWLDPLSSAHNPIDTLINIVEKSSMTSEEVRNGCPLNNLAQEMSPIHEGFRKRLARAFSDWIDHIAAALREGQKRRMVRSGLDPEDAATFFVALYEGYLSLAKNSQDMKLLNSGKKNIISYLESLRAQRARASGR